jgi:hypothetical protein
VAADDETVAVNVTSCPVAGVEDEAARVVVVEVRLDAEQVRVTALDVLVA